MPLGALPLQAVTSSTGQYATVGRTEEASGTTLGHLPCLKPLAAAFPVGL